MIVWLQMVKKSKNMNPTTYMRQDHDLLEVVKYCFFTSFNLWLNFLEMIRVELTKTHTILVQFSFALLLPNLVLPFAFISLPINRNCAQQLHSKPLLLHNPKH
jgi:hypothetical protein